MNKKLENCINEAFKYWDKNSHGVLFNEFGNPVSLELVKTQCRFFYNLALEDVKKEIESKLDVPNRKVKWREKHELEPDYNVRICVLLKDILDFIEKQEE